MSHWKPIPSFEGLYEVSDAGQVKSLSRVETTSAGWTRTKNEKLLKQFSDRYGRLYVDVCSRYKRHRWYIHRLVLTAFCGPCPEGMEACHNDGNQTNNCLSNLRWDTHVSNLSDKINHGTHIKGEAHKKSKLKPADIYKIRELRNCGLTQQSIAETFNVSRRLIGGILSGSKWAHL